MKCVICKAPLHYMVEHYIVSTAEKGIEGACRQHQSSTTLKRYYEKHGGEKLLKEAIKEL